MFGALRRLVYENILAIKCALNIIREISVLRGENWMTKKKRQKHNIAIVGFETRDLNRVMYYGQKGELDRSRISRIFSIV